MTFKYSNLIRILQTDAQTFKLQAANTQSRNN